MLISRLLWRCLFVGAVLACGGQTLSATDFFLTIGGGYNPSGNQASLEANVVFYQQILGEKHRGQRAHDIYFADGHDAGADLQVLAAKPARTTPPDRPATELLASVHRRRGAERLEYRNHRVPDIAGALDPALIHARLDSIASSATAGDRLIVYVTAHGSEGSKENPYNTTIDCWNERKITAREFARWLKELPEGVPVVMVMAQCYCGGFAHTIFEELDTKKGLAPQVRAGFFAQQHNLPAAGCRPDIANDEEFSSFFWGRDRRAQPHRRSDRRLRHRRQRKHFVCGSVRSRRHRQSHDRYSVKNVRCAAANV